MDQGALLAPLLLLVELLPCCYSSLIVAKVVTARVTTDATPISFSSQYVAITAIAIDVAIAIAALVAGTVAISSFIIICYNGLR